MAFQIIVLYILILIYKCIYILSSKETGRDTLIYQNRDTLILDTWGHYMSAHKQIKQINYIHVTNIFIAVSKTSDTQMLKSFIFTWKRCKKVKISPSIWADDFSKVFHRQKPPAAKSRSQWREVQVPQLTPSCLCTQLAQEKWRAWRGWHWLHSPWVRCENRSERRSQRQKASHRVLTNRALDILKGSMSPRSIKCPHDSSRCEGCRKMHRMIKLCSRSADKLSLEVTLTNGTRSGCHWRHENHIHKFNTKRNWTSFGRKLFEKNIVFCDSLCTLPIKRNGTQNFKGNVLVLEGMEFPLNIIEPWLLDEGII